MRKQKQKQAKPSTVSQTRKVFTLLVAQQHERRIQNVSLRTYKDVIERADTAGRLEWLIVHLQREIENIHDYFSSQAADWKKNGRCAMCGEWLVTPTTDQSRCDACLLLKQYEEFLLENSVSSSYIQPTHGGDHRDSGSGAEAV